MFLFSFQFQSFSILFWMPIFPFCHDYMSKVEPLCWQNNIHVKYFCGRDCWNYKYSSFREDYAVSEWCLRVGGGSVCVHTHRGSLISEAAENLIPEQNINKSPACTFTYGGEREVLFSQSKQDHTRRRSRSELNCFHLFVLVGEPTPTHTRPQAKQTWMAAFLLGCYCMWLDCNIKLQFSWQTITGVVT